MFINIEDKYNISTQLKFSISRDEALNTIFKTLS